MIRKTDLWQVRGTVRNSSLLTPFLFSVEYTGTGPSPNVSFLLGNGLGMRVIGGKEIPGSGGALAAFVARIYPGGVADRAGDIREGICCI